MTPTVSPLAVVILAHTDPVHLRRLIGALGDVPVVLHCDAKTDAATFAQMTRDLPDRVVLAPRLDIRLASWSLVAAELAGLRIALEQTSARHLAVLSGSDFPLVDPPTLRRELDRWVGRSLMLSLPLPYEPWNVRGFADGGLWRLRHYFPTRNDQLLWVAGKPVFVPLRRRIPADLEPRASSQWKIYCREDVTRLFEILDARPDLVAFARHTFTPEESFLASVLASPSLMGAAAHPPSTQHPWLISWAARRTQHPEWLTAADLSGPMSNPDGLALLFGRKFSASRRPDVVDRVEQSLWARAPEGSGERWS